MGIFDFLKGKKADQGAVAPVVADGGTEDSNGEVYSEAPSAADAHMTGASEAGPSEGSSGGE